MIPAEADHKQHQYIRYLIKHDRDKAFPRNLWKDGFFCF